MRALLGTASHFFEVLDFKSNIGRLSGRDDCVRGAATRHTIKLFYKSQFPHKSVSMFFRLGVVKDKLTNWWGGQLMQNDFKHTLCAIKVDDSQVETIACAALLLATSSSSLLLSSLALSDT
jgi:hypothetical protein